MKLNFNQIKSITQGAERVSEANGRIKFFRFNEEEQKLYSKSEFYPKTFSSAGIHMEFMTDAKAMFIRINTSVATSRSYFSLDVFVNEQYKGSIKNFCDKDAIGDYTIKQFELGEFSHNFELGEEDKKVKLVFPWSVATELYEIELEAATYIEPVKKEKKAVFFGDSITNGYDSIYSFNSYVERLSDELNLEAYNKAVGGEVFIPQLAKINRCINPDYIFVAYGTNDWSISEQEDFKKRCFAFYDSLAAKYPDTLIFAITPIWRADFKGERNFGLFEDVEKYIQEMCLNYNNIKVISGWDFVPHDENLFADFRLHPNDDGFSFYYDSLRKEVEKHIK